jgi:hypothetical protein
MLGKIKGKHYQEYYQNPAAYLLDQFEKVHLLLQYAVRRFRAATPLQTEPFNGFFISDQEIDVILERNSLATDPNGETESIRQTVKKLEDGIAAKLRLAEANGFVLPSTRLRNCLGLSDYELDVLLICLIPLYNADYQRLFAFLQNDVSRTLPSIQLIERILTDTFEERCRARDYFSSHMPLLKWQLISIGEDKSAGALTPTTPFSIDARIAGYLTGSTLLDSKTEPCLKVIDCHQTIEELLLAEELKARLHNLIDYLQLPAAGDTNHILAFSGPTGSGKKQIAAVMAHAIGIPLLSLRVAPILNNFEIFQNTIRRVLREVLLVGSGLLIEDFDLLMEDNLGLPPLSPT